jgi:hypothetical protein
MDSFDYPWRLSRQITLTREKMGQMTPQVARDATQEKLVVRSKLS